MFDIKHYIAPLVVGKNIIRIRLGFSMSNGSRILIRRLSSSIVGYLELLRCHDQEYLPIRSSSSMAIYKSVPTGFVGILRCFLAGAACLLYCVA